jgi:hypothetical protein
MSVFELLEFLVAHNDYVFYRVLPSDGREDPLFIALEHNWVNLRTNPEYQSSLNLNTIKAYGDTVAFGLVVSITLHGKAALAEHRIKVTEQTQQAVQLAGATNPPSGPKKPRANPYAQRNAWIAAASGTAAAIKKKLDELISTTHALWKTVSVKRINAIKKAAQEADESA